MAPKDFFHLNEEEYAIRISQYDDQHLKRQEIVKTRQIVSGFYSITTGVAFAVTTHGTTLIVTAYGVRRAQVAFRKLRMIKYQLRKREIDLHTFAKRDFLIPVIAGMVGTGIGLGVDFGIHALIPVGHLATDSANLGQHGANITASVVHGPLAQAPIGSSISEAGLSSTMGPGPLMFHPTMGEEISAVSHHPGQLFQGFGDGMIAQSHAEILALGDQVPVDISAGISAGDPMSHAIGYLFGAEAAVSAQQATFGYLGSQIAWWVTEKYDVESWIPKMSENLGCGRLAWALDVTCNICSERVEQGIFYHSCTRGQGDVVGDEEYDVCPTCFEREGEVFSQLSSSGPGCNAASEIQLRLSKLKSRQVAVCGDLCYPNKEAALLRGWNKWSAFQAPEKCNACAQKIKQGWYYTCADCRKGAFMLCIDCYKRGRTCDQPKLHLLYAFVWARIARFEDSAPYKSKDEAPECTAQCSECEESIYQGVFYHCKKCDEGNFDLCSQCYETGKTCRDPSHCLVRFNAWQYIYYPNPSKLDQWTCDIPNCTSKEKTGKDRLEWFSCRKCDKGNYIICRTCYFTGAGCRDREHRMIKYVFKQ